MADLMKRPSTELLLNFMFEEINRFLSHEDQLENFDALFGSPDWRKADELSGRARKNFLHDLYRDQLRSVAGARYVRSFEMLNDRGTSDYFCFSRRESFLVCER
jgi:three-Cys-motif partner protein